MNGKLWGDDIITSLICIFISTGQEMFLENLRNFKVSYMCTCNFLIFQPIFIRFSLLCLKIFTLSSQIKLNLLWSSSLIINSSHHRQFLLWGTSRLAKMDNQFLRNLIFIPFTKVASAHPRMNYFQICWCHMIDETFSHPCI